MYFGSVKSQACNLPGWISTGHQWLCICDINAYMYGWHTQMMKNALPWTFLAMLHQCPASLVSWRGYFPLIQRRCHHWSCLLHLLPSWAEPPRWWRSEFESLDAIIQEGKKENGFIYMKQRMRKTIQVQHDRNRVGLRLDRLYILQECFLTYAFSNLSLNYIYIYIQHDSRAVYI